MSIIVGFACWLLCFSNSVNELAACGGLRIRFGNIRFLKAYWKLKKLKDKEGVYGIK